jgi:hypothetical protein
MLKMHEEKGLLPHKQEINSKKVSSVSLETDIAIGYLAERINLVSVKMLLAITKYNLHVKLFREGNIYT